MEILVLEEFNSLDFIRLYENGQNETTQSLMKTAASEQHETSRPYTTTCAHGHRLCCLESILWRRTPLQTFCPQSAAIYILI